MSNSLTAAPPKVAPELYNHVRALLRAGGNDQAIARACAITVILPDDLCLRLPFSCLNDLPFGVRNVCVVRASSGSGACCTRS
jgi:hypothetical protein